jgi:hypothetical protein
VLRPGDRLVLRLASHVTSDEQHRLMVEAKAALPGTDVVFVGGAGILDMIVVRPAPSEGHVTGEQVAVAVAEATANPGHTVQVRVTA